VILQDSSGNTREGCAGQGGAACKHGWAQAAERSAMRQLLLALFGSIRRGAPRVLGSGLPLTSLALVIVGCAGPSLVLETQTAAIRDRDRALASHAAAIHAAIGQSGNVGALAFLDAKDGRLVVLPGDSSADAWSRYTTSPESGTGRVSVPPVLTFVHRADVPKAPETVTRSALQQQQALATLATELRDEPLTSSATTRAPSRTRSSARSKTSPRTTSGAKHAGSPPVTTSHARPSSQPVLAVGSHVPSSSSAHPTSRNPSAA